MGKRIQSIGGKLGLPSAKTISHFIVFEGVLEFIWWVVGKVIGDIPEIVIGWGYLVIFVAGIFAVAWYLPKLSPKYSGIMAQPKPPISRRQLKHDGVLWEDGGNNLWGNLDVIGPLCPKDYVPLAQRKGSKVDTNLSNDTLISDSGYHSQLFCPECKGEYTLGSTPKIVRDSRGEVGSRFEGMRRRNQDD